MVFMNLVWILRTTKEERERRHAIACSQNFLVLIKRERTSNSALFIKVRCVACIHTHTFDSADKRGEPVGEEIAFESIHKQYYI